VFSNPNEVGLLERITFRVGEKRVYGVLIFPFSDDKEEDKFSVADSGAGAVYFVVSSSEASMATVAKAWGTHGGGWEEVEGGVGVG